MPRSRAITGAFTMFTEVSCGRSTPISATWESGLMLRLPTWPSYSIDTALMSVSVSCPANEPSFSANSRNGASLGASSAVTFGMLSEFTIAPVSR